ncbi:MAG: hypothetical protein WCH11_05290 [Bdellovibrio sp.]
MIPSSWNLTDSHSLLIFCVYSMTGVIWLVQWVHYPLMRFISAENFVLFHAKHSSQITCVVGPLMLLQLLCSLHLVLRMPEEAWPHLLLTGLAFAATALISVPLHQLLARGWSASVHRRLVQTNWIRTLVWSVHSLWIGFFESLPLF